MLKTFPLVRGRCRTENYYVNFVHILRFHNLITHSHTLLFCFLLLPLSSFTITNNIWRKGMTTLDICIWCLELQSVLISRLRVDWGVHPSYCVWCASPPFLPYSGPTSADSFVDHYEATFSFRQKIVKNWRFIMVHSLDTQVYRRHLQLLSTTSSSGHSLSTQRRRQGKQEMLHLSRSPLEEEAGEGSWGTCTNLYIWRLNHYELQK